MKNIKTNIEIHPSKLSGTVKAIASKSQAHRGLICAYLSGTPDCIEYDTTSKDIEATVNCLAELKKDSPILHVGESGSTYRFLLPIVAALGKNAAFVLEGRLPERPLIPLFEDFRRGNPLKSGVFELDATVSSQFISGLLFALPLLDGDSEIRLLGKPESAPYVEMTVDMLNRFGVEVGFDGDVFTVRGNQTYRSHGRIIVEGDWSNAAFWLCAGAMSEKSVGCTGLDLQSIQGDRAVLDILRRFGAEVHTDGDCVKVRGGELHGIGIDASDIPDLVPILSVVATHAAGVTEIYNAGRLRLKESDRLAAVTETLTILGADIVEKRDGLVIHGGTPLKGGTVSSHNDHRIAMSAAVAGAVLCEKSVIIEGADAVNKSYPRFFSDLQFLQFLTRNK